MSDEINMIARIDQASAMADNVAVMIASYYEKLIAENIPEELASELARDFQAEIFKRPNA